MANANAVAVIIELLGWPKGLPVRYTIANGSAGTDIPEGTLMKISDPRTIAATSADNDAFAGILCKEKEGGDGSTNASVYTYGIFDLEQLTGVTATAGEKCSIGGANIISKVAAADLLFADVGIYLENASAEEIVAVLVTPGA